MAGKHGFGAAFYLHDGSQLTKISDVLAITPPSPTVETIDTTTHDSAGAVREFIAGLIDNGEGSIRINWIPGNASDTLLSAAVLSRANKAWKITVPAATGARQFTGDCVVTGFEKDDVVIDDKLTAVLTIKASGAITEGAAT